MLVQLAACSWSTPWRVLHDNRSVTQPNETAVTYILPRVSGRLTSAPTRRRFHVPPRQKCRRSRRTSVARRQFPSHRFFYRPATTCRSRLRSTISGASRADTATTAAAQLCRRRAVSRRMEPVDRSAGRPVSMQRRCSSIPKEQIYMPFSRQRDSRCKSAPARKHVTLASLFHWEPERVLNAACATFRRRSVPTDYGGVQSTRART